MQNSLNILVIDDDLVIQEFFLTCWEGVYNVSTASNAKEAFDILKIKSIDYIFSDYSMPGMNGIEIVKEVKQLYPEIQFIMISSHSDAGIIIEAIRQGAADYIRKPFSINEANIALERSMRLRDLNSNLHKISTQARQLEVDLSRSIDFELVGNSKAMLDVKQLMHKVAKSRDTSVLITGESGTGKELIAKGIHKMSERSKSYFGAINTPAIQETLFESEFFGHKKGSFTGAIADKSGWFEICENGTLFLDEIGDMPENLQVKLLRALEEKTFVKVGANKEIPFDVRIISATNKTQEIIKSGKCLRFDLYHRLSAFTIHIPPLRDRAEDIPALVEYYVAVFSKKMRKPIARISRDIIDKLQQYDFPGNVRELKNIVERALILCDETTLMLEHFPDLIDVSEIEAFQTLNLDELEKQAILKALALSDNNKSKAAQLLHIKWNALDRRLQKFDIKL